MCTKRQRELELGGIARQAGDDDAASAGLPRGDDAGDASLAGAEDDDGLAWGELRHLDGPAESCPNRVKQCRDLGCDLRRHAMHHGVRGQVYVRGVAAPEPGLQREWPEAHDGDGLAAAAESVAALDAVAAVPAGEHRLDGDSVASSDTPARGGDVADLVNDADGFVAGDRWQLRSKRALVLLVVAAADAACFDAEERIIVADARQRHVLPAQIADAVLDHGVGARGHARSIS